MNASTTARLDAAAAHLDTAADLAQADPAASSAVLAAMIRIVRAGITPGLPDEVRAPASTETVREQLLAALDHLDHVEPLDGPPDLLAWAWHLHELVGVVVQRAERS
jgi:hypothetical protein